MNRFQEFISVGCKNGTGLDKVTLRSFPAIPKASGRRLLIFGDSLVSNGGYLEPSLGYRTSGRGSISASFVMKLLRTVAVLLGQYSYLPAKAAPLSVPVIRGASIPLCVPTC